MERQPPGLVARRHLPPIVADPADVGPVVREEAPPEHEPGEEEEAKLAPEQSTVSVTEQCPRASRGRRLVGRETGDFRHDHGEHGECVDEEQAAAEPGKAAYPEPGLPPGQPADQRGGDDEQPEPTRARREREGDRLASGQRPGPARPDREKDGQRGQRNRQSR